MKAFFDYITWLFFARPAKQKLRTKALQSLRLYVKVVGGVRKGSMFAVLGIMGLSAITVGFFMLIGGLLWLANLHPDAYPWIMVGVGALLTIAGIAGFIFAFREKLWVDMSQVNELTAATLANFPVDERPSNPAVTALWAMAAEARIREHSRMEQQAQAAASTQAAPHAYSNAAASLYPTVETPLSPNASYAADAQPASRINPTLQPS